MKYKRQEMNKRWTERQGKEGKQKEIVCKLWTQEPENFDEEVKSLGTAWRLISHFLEDRQDIHYLFSY